MVKFITALANPGPVSSLNDSGVGPAASLSPSGAKWRAQREGEPGLYELDSSPVDELRSAAAAVREPAPPPKPAAKK